MQAAMNTSGGLFMVIAGILLLVSKKKGKAPYVFACIALLLSFVGVSAVRACVALMLFLSALGLRTNVPCEKGPAWMRKGAWTLTALGFMAINIVDQILITMKNIGMATLTVLVAQIAMVLLLLSMGVAAPGARVIKPRLQAVPAEGKEKVFSTVGTLLLIFVVFDFILGVKSAAGMAPTAQFSYAMNRLFEMQPLALLGALVQLIPDLAACVLLLSANGRKKNYLLAMGMLLLNHLPVAINATEMLVGFAGAPAGPRVLDNAAFGAVLVLMFFSAFGFTWNKKVFGKIPVLNALALLLSVVMLAGTAINGITDTKAAVDTAKRTTYEQVKNAYSGAVYDVAYDDYGACEEVCDTLYNELYETHYQAAYDRAYEVAYKRFYTENYDYYYAAQSWYGEPDVAYVKSRAENATKDDAHNAAENIANNYCQYILGGLSYQVYDAVVSYMAYTYAEDLAVKEAFNGKKPEDLVNNDVAEYILEAADEHEAALLATKATKDGLKEFLYNDEIYDAAAQAVKAEEIYHNSVDTAYDRIYGEIGQRCDEEGRIAAGNVAAERKGSVMKAILNVILSVVYVCIGLVALLMMNTALTTREAAPIPNNFRALLDWCYTNVGEKMQKCMKALGAFYLVLGMVSLAGLGLAVCLFFRGDFVAAAATLAMSIVGAIITAANILMTYPMFSFAQLTADIHHIRANGGMAAPVAAERVAAPAAAEEKTAPVAPAAPAAAPAAPVVAAEAPAAAEEEEFDDLPEL